MLVGEVGVPHLGLEVVVVRFGVPEVMFGVERSLRPETSGPVEIVD